MIFWTKNEDLKQCVEGTIFTFNYRLGLERGKTAFESLQAITKLLEEFGQGGPCSDIVPEHTYHNSFLIADPKEAWVLETARNYWVAEQITSGYRNISNCMSIRTKIDLMSHGLKEKCLNEGWWDGKSEFDWSQVIGEASKVPKTKLATPKERFQWGQKLLKESTKDGMLVEANYFRAEREIF